MLIHLENISFTYDQRVILDEVSLAISASQIVTLIGPNGAGKSTLARIVLNLLSPTTGKRWIKPGLTVGYLPQVFSVDPIFPLTVKRLMRLAAPQKKCEGALEEVGVSHLKEATLSLLSRGELQRVLLARTLLRDPELLVLDEPLQGVDFSGELELYKLISNIRKIRGCGILMISHDLHIVMAATDWVVCLNKHVCCSGAPEMVIQHPEYQALFGQRKLEEVLFFSHTHNHRHDGS
ncbi:MAG: ATP-binding cassette domain-containing protein [Gammaproteobacteria bacterium]|nr:ATP-binding cassette domain-containing protein [Gammaproteobacteria bacterium]